MWIAKDENGGVYIYTTKPVKNNGEWNGFLGKIDDIESAVNTTEYELIQDLINNLSYEDPEPVEIGRPIKILKSEEIEKMSEDYEKSINDPDCPFYTPEDIKKAYKEGIKKILGICG